MTENEPQEPQEGSGTSREELIMEIPASSPAEDKANSDEDGEDDGEEDEEDEEEAEAWWEGTEMGEDDNPEQNNLGENADESSLNLKSEGLVEDAKNMLPVSIFVSK